jgi:uncharacterized protein YjbI with pentapeptide repeats
MIYANRGLTALTCPGARFWASDLSGARFQGVDLSRVVMRGVDLVTQIAARRRGRRPQR